MNKYFMSSVLINSFTWGKTPQGYEYWNNWYEFLYKYRYTTDFYPLKKNYICSFIESSNLPKPLWADLHDALVLTGKFGDGNPNLANAWRGKK